MSRVRNTLAAVLAVGVGTALVFSTGAGAAAKSASSLPENLVNAVSADKVNKHLIAFQRYADQHGRSRAASTEGHRKSAEYIATKLEAAGFAVTRQEFPFVYDETAAESLSSGGTEYDIFRMSYSASGPEEGVTAPTFALPVDETPGCEATDYDGLDVAGKIVLVSRGARTFADKQTFAGEAGAVGAVIYNNT